LQQQVMDRRPNGGGSEQMLDNTRDHSQLEVLTPSDVPRTSAAGNFQFTFEIGQRSNQGSYIEPEVG
jgi:hypothetical protein